MENKTYNLWTIGCQMNEADSRHLGSQLEALGYTSQEKPAGADIVVLNTCVVRQQAEDKAVGRLHHVQYLKKKEPDMIIGLMGCMVGMKESGRLKGEYPFVDVFMPPSDTEPLLDYLAEQGAHAEEKLIETQKKAIQNAIQDEEHILPALRRGKSVLANVPIVLGCSHACTFCIIPYRRGAERSLPKEEILREIQKLTDQGVREVMLLGQIVDRYGEDFEEDYDLADLLHDVSKNENLLRIRFLTGHPNYWTPRMTEAVRDLPKVMPHIELPVQAGNNKVLEDMARGYTREDYIRVVKEIRDITPDVTINTDIIVGFPGETEEEFMDSYTLLEELRLDKIHLSKYSMRPKTIATRKMEDNVTDEEKEDRRIRIDALNDKILAEKNEKFNGATVEVLVEGKLKTRWKGRTPCNRLVFFEDPRHLTGALIDIDIKWAGPYSLIGGENVQIKVPPLHAELEILPVA